jgi:hypothetical protein
VFVGQELVALVLQLIAYGLRGVIELGFVFLELGGEGRWEEFDTIANIIHLISIGYIFGLERSCYEEV